MRIYRQAAIACIALEAALGGCRSAWAQGSGAAPAPNRIFDQTRETQIMAQILQQSVQPVGAKEGAASAKQAAADKTADETRRVLDAQAKRNAAEREALFNLGRFDEAQANDREGNGFSYYPSSSPFRAFRSSVSGSYVPTVGAIFNLSVDFPLSAPAAPPAAKSPSADKPDKDDLWEQLSAPQRSDAPGRESANGVFTLGSANDYKVAMDEPKGPEYDPAKVAALRKAILDAVGRYGWRMEHLADDERIVVVVASTAQGRRSDIVVYADPFSGQSNSVQSRRLASVSLNEDHLLLSFRKGDLKKQIDGDQLSGKATERSFVGDGSRLSPLPWVRPAATASTVKSPGSITVTVPSTTSTSGGASFDSESNPLSTTKP